MLLDRYGQVAADGTYTSSIENETRRFFTMLGTLVRGRVTVGGSAGAATKVALDIAVSYGDVRRQFTAPGRDREVVINDYLAHQRKLLPALATTYALHFAQEELVGKMHDVHTAVHVDGADVGERVQRELESRAAGLKAATTWHATRTIQMCREACGGAGYLAENRLPGLKADTDVFTTFEGDNTVLLQLVAKGLLTGYRDAFGSLAGWGKVGYVADHGPRNGAGTNRRPGTHPATGRCRSEPRRPGPDAQQGLAAEDVRIPREAHPGGRHPAAAQAGWRPVRHLQRCAGPRAADGTEPCRPSHSRGVRRRHRTCHRPGRPGAAGRGLQSVRALHHRGGQGLVPRTRTAHPDPGETVDQHGEFLAGATPAADGHASSRPSPSTTRGRPPASWRRNRPDKSRCWSPTTRFTQHRRGTRCR